MSDVTLRITPNLTDSNAPKTVVLMDDQFGLLWMALRGDPSNPNRVLPLGGGWLQVDEDVAAAMTLPDGLVAGDIQTNVASSTWQALQDSGTPVKKAAPKKSPARRATSGGHK